MHAQEIPGNRARRGRVLPHAGPAVPRKPQKQILGSQVRDEVGGGRMPRVEGVQLTVGESRQKATSEMFPSASGGTDTPVPLAGGTRGWRRIAPNSVSSPPLHPPPPGSVKWNPNTTLTGKMHIMKRDLTQMADEVSPVVPSPPAPSRLSRVA